MEAAARRVVWKESHGRSRGGASRLALLALLALLAPSGCAGEPAIRIVLVSLDTLRYDRFAGGESPGAMPRLRARARGGAGFTRLYAASPLTQPSHATLLTGLHPWEHGVTRNGQVLPDALETIPEQLRAAGFETRAVVASFPLARRFGFAQGFDAFHEEFTRPYFQKPVWEKRWAVPEDGFFSTADAITARAIEALDASRARRQFFWFHYFDPHSPYGVSRGEKLNKYHVLDLAGSDPEAAQRMLARVRELYDADVASLDTSLERLLARLDADAQAFETHVFLVSDHGESLGEEGSIGHGWRLADEELRVPAVLLSPRVAAGAREDVAGSIDVAATLRALAGLAPVRPDAGRDLTRPPSGPGGAFGMRRTFAGEGAEELRMDGVIHRIDEPRVFFAVAPDGRLATGNRASARLPAGVATPAGERERMLALFASFEARLAARELPDALDPEVEEGLRALGYLY